MKLLLVGPFPPPHGGVSVHVAEARRQLAEAGIACRVLNTDRRAPPSDLYLRARSGPGLALAVLRHSLDGWTIHVHTNGHNHKSWLIALACGLAGLPGPASLLTLHSGMAPAYLRQGSRLRRGLARLTCHLYDRMIAVSPEIHEALRELAVAAKRLVVLPAFLTPAPPRVELPAAAEQFVHAHRPLLCTALFFRPEYGFDLLVDAVARLRRRRPGIGCLVRGSGEQQAEARARVHQRGLDDAMLLLGDVPHEQCLALMSVSDLFVRPTLKDADAISVREALSLGIRVVASDVGTRPRGAVLFPAGDAEALALALESALAAGRPAQPQNAVAGGVGRLLEIYSL